MFITRIEQGMGKRYRVYSDSVFLFSLYRSELNRYHIAIDTNVPEGIIAEILEDVIYKRAKERALYLLERRSYTCSMMRDKLISSDYPIEIANQVISFLQDYHYLDDMAYVRMYVETYSKSRSKKQIRYDLQRKKLSQNLIDECMSQMDDFDEECLKKQFVRYTRGKDLKDWKVRQKIFRYFYGKGFSHDLIEECIKTKSDSIEDFI